MNPKTTLVFLAAAFAAGCSSSKDSVRSTPPDPPAKPVAATVAAAISPYHADWKGVPLDASVEKGLRWLASTQGADGGFGQDGGRDGSARDGVSLESSGNDVANTALACLAFLRGGSTADSGPHRDALVKGLRFVLGQIEEAPVDGLAITKRQGTQIQRKLGPCIDTFLASMLLSEIDGHVTDAALAKRVRGGLEKCVAKIEKNQQSDGSWNLAGGWAPVIGTSMASRGLYNAQAKGVTVQSEVLKRVDGYTKSGFDEKKGDFKAPAAEAAGVDLYSVAQALEQSSREGLSDDESRMMRDAATAKLSESRFLNGFGSMGGEEFVSYLNITDSLVRTRGKDWTEWNPKIKTHLSQLQNADGTWAGHHCITGRVACTSAAVMTLLGERQAPRVGA